jgi:hypothetical protein
MEKGGACTVLPVGNPFCWLRGQKKGHPKRGWPGSTPCGTWTLGRIRPGKTGAYADVQDAWRGYPLCSGASSAISDALPLWWRVVLGA